MFKPIFINWQRFFRVDSTQELEWNIASWVTVMGLHPKHTIDFAEFLSWKWKNMYHTFYLVPILFR